jgi:disulfide bond formation protein DsbB
MSVNSKYSLYFAWLLASFGMLGSLYFSQVRHLEPCNLCWFQRIALFPLPFILGLATYKNYLQIAPYVLPQLLFGLLFALYQIAIQEIPGWNPIDMCGKGPSCSEKIPIGLGFVSIPILSALLFFSLSLLLSFAWISEMRKKP